MRTGAKVAIGVGIGLAILFAVAFVMNTGALRGISNITPFVDPDPDKDGLTTEEERTFGSNPQLYDTDGDGLSDYAERQAGTNPINRNTDGDRYEDAADRQPTVHNVANISVEPYNFKTKTETGNVLKIALGVITGGLLLDPDTVIYTVQLDTDVSNIGTDYTSYVNYDIVFEINGEEVKRVHESISRMDVGARLTKHYEHGIRIIDVPQLIWDEISKGKQSQVTAEIQNLSYERF